MVGFITLRDKHNVVDIMLNAEQIVAIKDLRTDTATKGIKDFQFTVVTTTGGQFEVVETATEIVSMIYYLTHKKE